VGLKNCCLEKTQVWVSTIVQRNYVAIAIGFYTSMQSISTLITGSVDGWYWYAFSPATTFGVSSVGAILAIFYLMIYSESLQHRCLNA